MKVLFDCIVTQEPRKCSTTNQFIKLAKRLLKHDNLFIYWPVPDRFTEEEMEAYPKDERIKYFPLHQAKDRMKEYNRINPVLENLLAFNGIAWDWDVLVTVRSTQVPIMRIIATSPRQKHRIATKKILLIEDMMVSSKKPTVALSNAPVQDRMTIEAYLASDKTFIPAYHERKWAIELAKRYFSPAMVKGVSDKIREVCHLDMPKYSLKTTHKYKKGERKMNLVFVGRLEKGVGVDLMNILMSNQFILHSEDVNVFVCTVSDGTKGFDTSVVDVRHPHREEFWKICDTEMDLAMSFSVDVELNLSKLEPITFGVPLLVVKAPWSIGMLGEDYPFFVAGEIQAYGLISQFRDNYDAMYEKFIKWQKEWFVPTYTKRCEEDGMYKLLEEGILEGVDDSEESLASLKNNEIVQLIAKNAGKEFVLYDLIEKLGDTVLRTLADKIKDNDRATRSLVFSTPWNEFRLALKTFYGYEDASTKLGHMRKM